MKALEFLKSIIDEIQRHLKDMNNEVWERIEQEREHKWL